VTVLSESQLHKILRDPTLSSFIEEIQGGKVLFYEGDESQDIYILLEGSLEVKKSGKIISKINTPGEIFGEMASLLDNRRSATIKAHTDCKILKIPYQEFQKISQNYPWLYQIIYQSLAYKMKITTELNLSLSELCNSLSDSVIIVNSERKIVQANQQALDLVNGDPEQLIGLEIEKIFVEREKCIQNIDRSKYEGTVKEQHLTITKNNSIKHLSTTITCFKDHTGKVTHFIFFLRDITRQVSLERKLKITTRALVILILISLPFITYILYKHKETYTGKPDKIIYSNNFIEQLKHDTKSNANVIAPAILGNDIKLLEKLIGEIFNQSGIYNRIILIDKHKTVLVDYYKNPSYKKIQKYPIGQLIDSGAYFQVLRVYETDKDYSTSRKILHIAYRIEKDKKTIGWIIFEPKELDIPDGITEFN